MSSFRAGRASKPWLPDCREWITQAYQSLFCLACAPNSCPFIDLLLSHRQAPGCSWITHVTFFSRLLAKWTSFLLQHLFSELTWSSPGLFLLHWLLLLSLLCWHLLLFWPLKVGVTQTGLYLLFLFSLTYIFTLPDYIRYVTTTCSHYFCKWKSGEYTNFLIQPNISNLNLFSELISNWLPDISIGCLICISNIKHIPNGVFVSIHLAQLQVFSVTKCHDLTVIFDVSIFLISKMQSITKSSPFAISL